MFSTLPKTSFNFSANFNLSSANALNLDQCENLSFGKELWVRVEIKNICRRESGSNHGTCLINMAQNIVGIKKENADNQHFLPYP